MGIIEKIKSGLKKTKDSISKKFFEAFKSRRLDSEFYSALETALISSDVGVEATDRIISDLKDVAFRKRLVDPDSVKAELRAILRDSVDYDIPEYRYPLVILLAGVNGAGKTTAVGKLANLFRALGKSVIVAAADTFRAAASDQLEVWAERAKARIVKHGEGGDPAAVVFDAISSLKARNADVLLVDTAGRLHNKPNLMRELEKIDRVISRELPDADRRNFIVLDATVGQNALNQAGVFDAAIDIDGIVLTKLDGTARGGVVLAISEELGLPVTYIGVGEKIDDLLPFDADDFISAIL